MQVGFIGLGAMGYGMAGRIGRSHALTVYNRTAAKAAELVAGGAALATAPEGLGACDLICSMLSDDAAVENVFLPGGSLAAWLRPGAVHLSHSTISPEMVDRLSRAHADAGVGFVCAPVLGRPDKAAAGQLVAIVAGPEEAIARCATVIDAISRAHYFVGPDARMAATAKIGVNFLVAVALESLAEGFSLVRKAGIDPEAFLSLVTETIFDSQVYNAYAPLVARELRPEPSFKTVLGLKDVTLARTEAASLNVDLPLAALVAERLNAAIADGYGDEDWSSLARFAARQAGIPAPDAGPEVS